MCYILDKNIIWFIVSIKQNHAENLDEHTKNILLLIVKIDKWFWKSNQGWIYFVGCNALKREMPKVEFDLEFFMVEHIPYYGIKTDCKKPNTLSAVCLP